MCLRSVLFRFLLLCGCGVACARVGAQSASTPTHGMWVWRSSSVLGASGGIEALSRFCGAHGVNEVYVSFSSTGGSAGRAAEDALLAKAIRVLHGSDGSRIRVGALLSSTDADEEGKAREKLLGHIREVIAFNQSHPGDRFDGVHLDIEPQQRPENKGQGNLRFLPGLVGTFRAARELTAPAHLSLNVDIQTKFLKGDLEQRRRLLTSVPRMTLMLHELSSPSDGETMAQKEEKLRSASRKVMEMAYAGLGDRDLAKMAVGLRTPDTSNSFRRC